MPTCLLDRTPHRTPRAAASLLATLAALILLSGLVHAQDAVQRRLGDDDIAGDWIYGDWENARRLARDTGKPIFAVFRCVP